MQIEELAAGMRHAADFSDALVEARFVTGEIVAHQLAISLAKKVACMVARAARVEVINYYRERRKRRSAVSQT